MPPPARPRRPSTAADGVGYPLLVRPSYVLGGRAMEICYSRDGARGLPASAPPRAAGPAGTIFLDRFLENAIEVDVDALCDGESVRIGAIMQHVEEAGVHSGDSACVIPAMSLGPEMIRQVETATERLALRLGVVGLINIQFAVHGDDELYVIEANPRASRTVPFVSKAVGVPLAKVACRLMLGERLAEMDLDIPTVPGHVSVKEAVLPFGRFPRADSLLGPEMKSTGEVMGVASDYPAAFGKAQAAAGAELPASGTVFISVTDGDKPTATQLAASLHDLGFEVLATGRHRPGDPQDGRAGGAHPQAQRGVSQRGRADRVRRRGPGGEHAHRLRRARRRVRDPPRRRGPRHPLHHHDERRQRRPARHPRPPLRSARADPAPGAARQPPGGGPVARPGGQGRRVSGGEPRTLAPPERRRTEVTADERVGAYSLISAPRPRRARGAQAGAVLHAGLGGAVGWGRGRAPVPAARLLLRAGPPGPGGVELSFLLEDVGPGTHRLGELRPGDGLHVLGPLGDRLQRRPATAAGPCSAAAGSARRRCCAGRRAARRRAEVLLGFRSARARRGAPRCSTAGPTVVTDDGSVGAPGAGHRAAARPRSQDDPHAAVYACGPPAMLEGVRALCAALEVPAQLAMESGMACGFGACFGCVVATRDGFVRLCVDGPVLDAGSLETALTPGAGH